MTDRDLTPAEARAEVEAFMGEGWTVRFADWGTPKAVIADHSTVGVRVRGDGPTYRAAVSALKSAWRDAVRPLALAAALDKCGDAVETARRVLKEDDK